MKRNRVARKPPEQFFAFVLRQLAAAATGELSTWPSPL
jgi:hypothetical protein